MTATDAQVRIALSERKRGRTQAQAAAKANLRCRETVAKYEKLGKLPSELKKPRRYRTRADPFAEDWPQVAEMLGAAPGLQAKALFDWLCGRRPGRYTEGQLRTFQRKVSRWRALNVPKILMLEQDRVPGEAMQTDGTWMNELEISIAGEPFEHMLIHSVLPYSNWEWGTVAQSESLLALMDGFQSAIGQLGHVPAVHQTDNTTAATHNLKLVSSEAERAESGRCYNSDYLALMDHYGVKPRTTHLHSPDENGDIEAAHGALIRAIEQHLLLRGSRDFESVEAYEVFLQQIMTRRNSLRQPRLAEELERMRPLAVTALPAVREYRPRVARSGTIRVMGNVYSVPSGLVGKQVVARVHEWHIEVYFGAQLIQQVPRLTGKRNSNVNYRHIIHTLLRKPGGFRRYRYREQMFPTPIFREAWEALDAGKSPRRADIAYLRILKLAADNLQSDVELALRLVLESGQRWDEETIVNLVKPAIPSAPHVEQAPVNLADYDLLLGFKEAARDIA